MLCGHTHGGQFKVPFLNFTPFAPVSDHSMVEGLHSWKGRQIHVTRGVGNLWGIRLNCRPEISLLEIGLLDSVPKVYFLDDRDPPWFPDPSLSDRNGLVAISETLGTDRLILAYQKGIFPWLKMGEYPLWHWFSPDPRFLLFPKDFKQTRSLKKAVTEDRFDIRINQNFRQVIESCASVKRPKEEGTWIEDDMIEDYQKLHQQGIAHSIEAYHQNLLVGGLYGLCLGSSFLENRCFILNPKRPRFA